MSNNKVAGSKALTGVFFAALFTVTGIASCGGSGGSPPATSTAAPTLTFSASPSSITNGATSTLSWSSTDSTSCTSSGGGGTGTTGSFTTPPLTTTTTYTVTCTGSGGTISQSTTVTVGAAPAISSFLASSTFIGTGTTTTLSWSSTDSTSCTLSAALATGGVTLAPTPVGTAGSQSTGPLLATTIYTLFCSNAALVNSPVSNTTITVGCLPTNVSGAITLPNSNIASRLNGVAPLAVFFDASATTNTPLTRPFHDLEYRWDFGDKTGAVQNLSPPLTGTSTWSTGSRAGASSRNAATGPVAAHVYETPGNYTVTLTATDGTNTESNACIGITVENPDTIFASANTTCIGATSNPVQGVGGCPAGANTAQQSNFATAISSYALTGKRVLFKRGDTFTAVASSTISAAGPGIIGAYGSTASSPPAVSMGAVGANAKVLSFSAIDWRVMDMKFDGTGSTDQFGINVAESNLTLLRLVMSNFSTDVQVAAPRIINSLALIDSTLTLGGGTTTVDYGLLCIPNGAYSCSNLMIMGNSINLNPAPSTSHNIRTKHAVTFVLENNTLVGGYNITPFTLRGNSYNGEVSDNISQDGNSAISPASSTVLEYQHDIIMERNWFLPGTYGLPFQLSGSYVTVRNNIFNTTGSTLPHALSITWQNPTVPGAIEPTGNYIYNNSFYNGSTNTGMNVIRFFSGLDSGCVTTIENNLAYAPNGTSPQLIGIVGGTCTVIGASGTYGNSSDSQMKGTNPYINAGGSFALTTDFKPISTPTCGSGTAYACQGGYSPAPALWTDFFGTTRTSPYDIGAVNH